MDLHAGSSNTIPSLLLGAGSDAPSGPIGLLHAGSPGDLRHEQIHVNHTGQRNPSPAYSHALTLLLILLYFSWHYDFEYTCCCNLR